MAERRSMEKQLLLTRTLNALPLADSSTTSITYKLVMLLIKRRKFLFKLSESILYENFNQFFMFCVTEHLRHMACSIIEINITMFTGFAIDHYLQDD